MTHDDDFRLIILRRQKKYEEKIILGNIPKRNLDKNVNNGAIRNIYASLFPGQSCKGIFLARSLNHEYEKINAKM